MLKRNKPPPKRRLLSTAADFAAKKKRTMTYQVCFEKNYTDANCPTLLARTVVFTPTADALPPATARRRRHRL